MRDMLENMQSLPLVFKQYSNFSHVGFAELCCLVVLVINKNAKSTRLLCIIYDHPLKLMFEQLLLNFNLYMIMSTLMILHIEIGLGLVCVMPSS